MKTRIKLPLVVLIGAVLLVALPMTSSAQQARSVADGVRLWSQNCGRCHNFRPAEERSDGEWAVIMSHMRVRANLTRSTAEAILAFLQTSNGADGSMAALSGAAGEASDTALPEETDARRLAWSVAMRLLSEGWGWNGLPRP